MPKIIPSKLKRKRRKRLLIFSILLLLIIAIIAAEFWFFGDNAPTPDPQDEPIDRHVNLPKEYTQ